MGRRDKREQVFKKYHGRCAYTGTVLQEDWQMDHLVPKSRGGTHHIDNLVPCQKIVNHYKRSLSVDEFRIWYLGGLHNRLKKLPKNPKTQQSIKRKKYLFELAELFGITPEKPFCGTFYFEKEREV